MSVRLVNDSLAIAADADHGWRVVLLLLLLSTVVAVSTSRKYPNDVMLNVMYNYM